jgi:hypothetical protein
MPQRRIPWCLSFGFTALTVLANVLPKSRECAAAAHLQRQMLKNKPDLAGIETFKEAGQCDHSRLRLQSPALSAFAYLGTGP